MDNICAEQRPLCVLDAMRYLDTVKARFHDRPEVYNRFLDIMKDFQSANINTLAMIKRVSRLLMAHQDLIRGFSIFMPPEYSIKPELDGSITIRSPVGTSRVVADQASL
ncbi:Transcriptional regulatory protein sin3 [Serendipita sp. 411]|nr:Transcriptional regulatory protein sin3 [Serendipita sp. 397]KAG8782645.1 Transcriptional regulatory protein sin3 [Serendipita sp. 398]KAG8844314.1 Transcriptional regulatory protein sin3 [Serendipita sp. 411]